MRRWVLVLSLLVVALAGADYAYWNWAAQTLLRGIQTWVTERRAEGWRIELGPISVAGWPNVVTARIASIHMARFAREIDGDIDISVNGTTLSVALWRPTELSLVLDGDQRVALNGRPPYLLRGDSLSASIPLANQASTPVTAQGRGLRLEAGDGVWVTVIAAIDGEAMMARTDQGQPAVDFGIAATGIELPNSVKWPLGTSIRNIAIAGRCDGPFPAARSAATLARDWRDGGGSLELKQATVDWGPLVMSGTATLALDDQLQPMGSGNAKVTGYVEALDRLAAAGVLTRSAATVAKAMLSLLAGTGTGDVPTEVEVPLSLQYRTLSMRQVPLVRLPELDWPSQ